MKRYTRHEKTTSYFQNRRMSKKLEEIRAEEENNNRLENLSAETVHLYSNNFLVAFCNHRFDELTADQKQAMLTEIKKRQLRFFTPRKDLRLCVEKILNDSSRTRIENSMKQN